MDSTLAVLLAVLACTFIGMIAAIIAATSRPDRAGPPTHAPKPVPKLMQAAKPAELKAVQWFDVPVRAMPQDSVRYQGVVVVTRHVDVTHQLR